METSLSKVLSLVHSPRRLSNGEIAFIPLREATAVPMAECDQTGVATCCAVKICAREYDCAGGDEAKLAVVILARTPLQDEAGCHFDNDLRKWTRGYC